MRALALLLLLTAAAAVHADVICPAGMQKATAADRAELRAVGNQAFTTHASKVCDKMPVLVTELEAFGTDIEAVCVSPSRSAAVFLAAFNSPCKDGASDAVLMTVNTKPAHCRKTSVPRLARWGWHTSTPGNMRPLKCAKGFRTATKRDAKLLTAFLAAQFTEVEMPHRLSADGGHFYCHGGVTKMRFHYVNGCIQTWPKKVGPYVEAQGKIDYTCYGSNKVLKLGLDGEGTYKTACSWKVSFAPV